MFSGIRVTCNPLYLLLKPCFNFSDNFSETQDERNTNRVAIKKKFLKFIKEFQESENVLVFKYRDALKKNYLRLENKLEVNMEDLKGFDEQLCERLKQAPAEMLALLEEAAKEAAEAKAAAEAEAKAAAEAESGDEAAEEAPAEA